MTAQRPDFPVDEDAGLVKFSQVSEDQTSRSMRLLLYFQLCKHTSPGLHTLTVSRRMLQAGQAQQAVSPALTLRERGDFGCSQQAGSRVS